jgi:hypothetical protein
VEQHLWGHTPVSPTTPLNIQAELEASMCCLCDCT